MNHCLAGFIFFLILFAFAHLSGARENQAGDESLQNPVAETRVEIEDEREMMEDAELLELMELLEQMELIQEMDLFMEGNTDEKEE